MTAEPSPVDNLCPTRRDNQQNGFTDAPHVRIHAINVFVRDQERSLRFYVDQLGFEVAFDALPHNGDRWIAVALPTAPPSCRWLHPSSIGRIQADRATGIVVVTENDPLMYAEWCR